MTETDDTTGQRTVRANGVDLCVQTFGDPADPAVLLISGAAASMDWWEVGFCERLAAGRRHVIRYDHRDTGRSTGFPAGSPPYTGGDLVDDAVGLLDGLGIGRAHVVGLSMGGGIAQYLALGHPDRVASLTLMSTSPAVDREPGRPDLPPSVERVRAMFATPPPPPDWSDRDAVLEYIVAGERTFAGSVPLDEARVRTLAGQVYDRTVDIAASLTNHWVMDSGAELSARLDEITAPTLVVHGTEDPLFPYAHAEALAAEIPDARLLPLEGGGHQVPPPAAWDLVVPALLSHTSGGWDEQADRLAATSLAAGDPTGWFERLYSSAVAGEVPMPWDRTAPHPMLADWAGARGLTGAGQRAVVVGCGLGADAEYLAGLGFDTVGFDLSATAIRQAGERHPGSAVTYRQADLLDLPAEWTGAFDLVVEIFTVQALPASIRGAAIASVPTLVAPGGTLVVVAFADPEGAGTGDGPPWPLTRADVDAFAAGDLAPVQVEVVDLPDRPGEHRWRAELHRP